MRRREVLAGTAAAMGSLALSGSVGATDYAWRTGGVGETSDADILVEFDRSFLERYQPYLDMSLSVRNASPTHHGYKVTSEDWEFDWACYWMQLAVQDGMFILADQDSHLGDHEPVYVAVDKTDGEVDRAIYSAWHHMVGAQRQSGLVLQEERADYPTHPTFRVDPNHHHYYNATEPGGTLLDPLQNWLDVRDRWIDNGFYESTSAEAIEAPEVMLERGTWWADGTLDARLAPWFHRFGFGGARGADPLRG